MTRIILRAAALPVLAAVLLCAGAQPSTTAAVSAGNVPTVAAVTAELRAANNGSEVATGGEASRACRAGLWAITKPNMLLVGAALMWLGC